MSNVQTTRVQHSAALPDYPAIPVEVAQVRKTQTYCLVLDMIASVVGGVVAVLIAASMLSSGILGTHLPLQWEENKWIAMGVGAAILVATMFVVTLILWLSSVLSLLSVIEYNTRRSP